MLALDSPILLAGEKPTEYAVNHFATTTWQKDVAGYSVFAWREEATEPNPPSTIAFSARRNQLLEGGSSSQFGGGGSSVGPSFMLAGISK